MEALHDEDLCQNQDIMAKRLKDKTMIQKQGNWVMYELKPGDVVTTFHVRYIASTSKRDFLHNVKTGHEKWIRCNTSNSVQSNIHESKLMLCILWDQLLQLNKTIITGAHHPKQLMYVNHAIGQSS